MKTLRLFPRAFPSLQRPFITNQTYQRILPSPVLNNIINTARRKPPRAHLCSKNRPYSTNPAKPPYNPTPHLNSPTASLSLSQRLRKLSREYGWSAFGVYLLLSALDFPFCFAAVRYLGAERVGHYEHVVLEWVKSAIPESVVERWREMRRRMQRTTEDDGERGAVAGGRVAGEEAKVEAYAAQMGGAEVAVIQGYDHGVKEAEEMNKSENASIWTQLALAYAIHKSFIFIRVPLTVAVTPKVVKVLRGWGWDIGKRRPKGSRGTQRD